jgi:hypothetical protein
VLKSGRRPKVQKVERAVTVKVVQKAEKDLMKKQNEIKRISKMDGRKTICDLFMSLAAKSSTAGSPVT